MSRVGKRAVNRYDLYEMVVQLPEMQARFLRAVHGRDAAVLGEDFCGPASIARAWLLLDDGHKAFGVDRDPEPLEHARVRAREQLGAAASRLTLRETDVMAAGDKADIVAAFNFAVCELHVRQQLVTYLRRVVYRLNAGGVFAADLYGGSDAFSPGESEQSVKTEIGTVKYTWEQREADALSGRVENAMHFGLPSGAGKPMKDAFVYDWRLWSVPELRDAMREAGFAKTEVYSNYGDAMDGDGNLIVHPVAWDGATGAVGEELDENWVVYVVGRV